MDLAWAGVPATRARFWAVASGLHSRPALIHHGGFQHGVQVSLTPLGAPALFGIPAAALARELVPLDDLAGVSPSLPERLAAAPDWAGRFDTLDEVLLGLVDARRHGALAAEVSRAWSLLLARHGRIRVGELAEEVGWSRRHLGQRFTDELGITPKEAARIFRFQHSRRLVTGGARLVEAALEAGYADQAHLTREWRELAGYAPTEYLHEELPFLQDEGAAR